MKTVTLPPPVPVESPKRTDLTALQELAAQCDLLATFGQLLQLARRNALTSETLLLVENELLHCGVHHHSPDPSALYGSVQWKRQIERLKARHEEQRKIALVKASEGEQKKAEEAKEEGREERAA